MQPAEGEGEKGEEVIWRVYGRGQEMGGGEGIGQEEVDRDMGGGRGVR